jgi:alkanesulfonate monooxygenase SsuD/methylene tetrahydromethanopterin reductase-like flavin-dependent oxidoreductase (luciferase family)
MRQEAARWCLDLSGSRLILGLGNGWDANEFANLGLPFLPARERQVARSADACNIMQIDPFGGGLLSPEAVGRKLAVLRGHCEEIGRPFDTVLRTYTTGWTILAQDEAALQAKLAHYFPEGIEQRYQGAWRDYVFHATPDRAIAHFRALIDAGIQYFIVETMDAMDHETIRLLATDVTPSIWKRPSVS